MHKLSQIALYINLKCYTIDYIGIKVSCGKMKRNLNTAILKSKIKCHPGIKVLKEKMIHQSSYHKNIKRQNNILVILAQRY